MKKKNKNIHISSRISNLEYGKMKSKRLYIPDRIMIIDLGSNAMRAQLFQKEKNKFRTIYQKRFSTRLGDDVFQFGKMRPAKIAQLTHAFRDLWLTCKDYATQHVIAVATSAFREAQNQKKVIEVIKKETDIQLQIISGKQEADLIFLAVSSMINLRNKKAIVIDIGGGSTELLFTHNQKIKSSASLPLGTVRLLQLGTMKKLVLEVEQKLNRYIKSLHQKNERYDFLIGTGGNFKSIAKLCDNISKKNDKVSIVKFTELCQLRKELLSMSLRERMHYFALRSDRADVIIPALHVTIEIMKKYQLRFLYAPDVGLKDGILISEFLH